VRARVAAARERQHARQGCCNAELDVAALKRHCALDDGGRALLARAAERLALSARSYHKILRLARTIADLDAQAAIMSSHLAEAVSYRMLDRGVQSKGRT
jgi:magnesium chelatase family protein